VAEKVNRVAEPGESAERIRLATQAIDSAQLCVRESLAFYHQRVRNPLSCLSTFYFFALSSLCAIIVAQHVAIVHNGESSKPVNIKQLKDIESA
jgi:hypothetical protein